LSLARRPEPWLSRRVELIGGLLESATLIDDDQLRLTVVIRVYESMNSVRFTCVVHSADGSPVGTAFAEGAGPGPEASEEATFDVTFNGVALGAGRYYLTLGVGDADSPLGSMHSNYDAVTEVMHFERAPNAHDEGPEVWFSGWGNVRFPPGQVVHRRW
jgi:hypothetical protein